MGSPVYKTVDTCAAEFAADTPYHYSTYERENEARKSDKKQIVILGAGRTGSGRESNSTTAAFTASWAGR